MTHYNLDYPDVVVGDTFEVQGEVFELQEIARDEWEEVLNYYDGESCPMCAAYGHTACNSLVNVCSGSFPYYFVKSERK